MKKVRVRYAPSPTGFLHIGGARSALYNYLFAKHLNGEFIVRMEDTDIERNVAGGEESQLNGLAWLKILADESPSNPNPKYAPYRQMERLEIYKKYALELVEKGYAYYCFCTEEELEKEREEQSANNMAPKYSEKCRHLTKDQIKQYELEEKKPCIRIHMKDNYTIAFDDLIRGTVSFETKDIGDYVILKSNGIPTYNFAVVIDDYTMEISHVLRGEEHLSNTPKQLQIFDYFNWERPVYGHLTLITNELGKKLSKRDPSIIQFIEQYKELGYLPEAIFNFLLLLGWSSSDDKEIFSIQEAIEAFNYKRLSKAPSMFDVNKLKWLNNYYIKQLESEQLVKLIAPFLKEYGIDNDLVLINKLGQLYREQLSYGAEIASLVKPFFNYELELSEESENLLKTDNTKKVIELFLRLLEESDVVVSDNYKTLIKEVQKTTSIKGKELYMPLRLVVFGKEHGPDLTSSFDILGKEKIIKRIKSFLD